MNKNYIFTSLGICILILLSLFSVYLYYSLELYDGFLIYIALALIIMIVLCIFLYFSRKSTLYNACTFLVILCNTILLYNIIDIEDRTCYVSNLITRKYNYETYELYVQNRNPKYNNISKLENKTIGLLNDNEIYVISYFRKVTSVNVKVYNSLEEIEEGISNGEIQGFIISNKNFNKSDCDIKYKVKSVYHGKIKENL